MLYTIKQIQKEAIASIMNGFAHPWEASRSFGVSDNSGNQRRNRVQRASRGYQQPQIQPEFDENQTDEAMESQKANNQVENQYVGKEKFPQINEETLKQLSPEDREQFKAYIHSLDGANGDKVIYFDEVHKDTLVNEQQLRKVFYRDHCGCLRSYQAVENVNSLRKVPKEDFNKFLQFCRDKLGITNPEELLSSKQGLDVEEIYEKMKNFEGKQQIQEGSKENLENLSAEFYLKQIDKELKGTEESEAEKLFDIAQLLEIEGRDKAFFASLKSEQIGEAIKAIEEQLVDYRNIQANDGQQLFKHPYAPSQNVQKIKEIVGNLGQKDDEQNGGTAPASNPDEKPNTNPNGGENSNGNGAESGNNTIPPTGAENGEQKPEENQKDSDNGYFDNWGLPSTLLTAISALAGGTALVLTYLKERNKKLEEDKEKAKKELDKENNPEKKAEKEKEIQKLQNEIDHNNKNMKLIADESEKVKNENRLKEVDKEIKEITEKIKSDNIEQTEKDKLAGKRQALLLEKNSLEQKLNEKSSEEPKPATDEIKADEKLESENLSKSIKDATTLEQLENETKEIGEVISEKLQKEITDKALELAKQENESLGKTFGDKMKSLLKAGEIKGFDKEIKETFEKFNRELETAKANNILSPEKATEIFEKLKKDKTGEKIDRLEKIGKFLDVVAKK